MTNESRPARKRGRVGGARAPRHGGGFLDLHEGVLGEFAERAAFLVAERALVADVVARDRDSAKGAA
jgi:hypothetical protein